MIDHVAISNKICDVSSDVVLGLLAGRVKVYGKDELLWDQIFEVQKYLTSRYTREAIKSIPEIRASREVYKKLGRNPDRYPLSSEALLKRIISGKDLYQINNIVDINNLISLKSCHSVGTYDLDNIEEGIVFDVGNEGESYESLGKGLFDITNLPVFRDRLGAFGSPTSDSSRTCIRSKTEKIMLVIISFSGAETMEKYLTMAEALLTDFGNLSGVEKRIVT